LRDVLSGGSLLATGIAAITMAVNVTTLAVAQDATPLSANT
jgi:hypothetical protein